jgi:hypothetical protein
VLVRNAWLGEETAARNEAPSAAAIRGGGLTPGRYVPFEVADAAGGSTLPGQDAEKRLASAART